VPEERKINDADLEELKAKLGLRTLKISQRFPECLED
jgi:hypothetical protein